ncbi:hypothetical protein RE474_03325 [Methanolobus sediminis]|uniref:Uncharacterized protein n=1 Tax=Methanolobus sediminis TaxID=3072978 RepID=A0AA51ULI2_9EURY|nr:hypothetical protein [Methanolobus sediminis]WMW25764.1 hypothetical protein RE474_03325 [Methanolobus sediminis]
MINEVTILKKNDANGNLNIIIAAVSVVIIGVLTIVAASGMVYIPVLTEVLGTDEAVDLGVETDPLLFDNLVEEQGVTLKDPVSQYQLTSNIVYSDTAPMDVSLTSSDLSSYLQATNNEGPLRDIQVKLGDNNQAEMSAYLDLKEYGYNFKGPVYAEGSISKGSDNTISIDIDSAKVGLLPLPEGSIEQGGQELESLINSHLAKMPDLRIDTLEISEGNLNFQGDFPRTADVVDE